MELQKATSDAAQALLHAAYHAEGEFARHRAIMLADEHHLTHLLPAEAHGQMHDMGVLHKHEGMDEPAEHEHTVVKAYNPISQDFDISKSWTDEVGNTYVEGYISPASPDKVKHQFDPEAFKDSLGSYFSRMAPVSTNHGMKQYPVGHMQKAALVRDGAIFKEFFHPTDPHDFTQFDHTGSGWYGRIVINDSQASAAIQKGNLGGFSWTGNANQWVNLPNGGKRFTNVNHVMESTVAAYPVHQDATIAIAKAYGLEEEPPTMPNPNTDRRLEDLMAQILNHQEPEAQPEAQVSKGITAEELTAALLTVTRTLSDAFDQKIQKAQEDAAFTRNAPAGNRPGSQQQTSDPQAELEADPVGYLIKKAATPEGLSDEDGPLMWEICKAQLTRGMEKSSAGDGFGITWL